MTPEQTMLKCLEGSFTTYAGNPDASTRRAGYGERMKWLLAHKDFEGDVCITWPFSKYRKGYCTMNVDGHATSGHRVMCELKHGPPPAKEYHAAHSCNHPDCLNPNHVRWATKQENEDDKIIWGTRPYAEKNGMGKLTDNQVAEIKAITNKSAQQIAADYGVSRSAISNIQHGNRRAYPQPTVNLGFHDKQPPIITTVPEAILTLEPVTIPEPTVTLEAIKNAVSTYFGIPVHEIISPRRETRLVNCRMCYYWLARDLTLASFPMIGRHCGNRDHSTVMNGIHTTKRFWKRFEPAIMALKRELGK